MQSNPSTLRRPAAAGRSPLALLALSLVALAGCGPLRTPAAPEAGALLGPGDVLRLHNEWADSIQHVWSRAELLLNFPRGQGSENRKQFDIEGHLFLVKPDKLFLHGEVLGQEMFKLGMNPEQYWLWIRPDVNTVWLGRRGGTGEQRLVMPPEALMTALGVFHIEPAPEASAVFIALERYYILCESRGVGGTQVPFRRVWFDRRTLRPARIDLFDDTGRRVLFAELLRYERFGETDVCTVYRARNYRDEEVDVVIQLSGVSLEKKPSPKVFEYHLPAGATERDMDDAEPPPAPAKP